LAAADHAHLDLAGAPVDDRIPFGFGVRFYRLVEAGDELAGKVCRSTVMPQAWSEYPDALWAWNEPKTLLRKNPGRTMVPP